MRKIIAIILVMSLIALVSCTPDPGENGGSTPIVPEKTPAVSEPSGVTDPESDASEPDAPESSPVSPETEAPAPEETPVETEPETTKKPSAYVTLPRDIF